MNHILDAGPLTAALNCNDRYHRWACEILAQRGPPFPTGAEVLAEAAAKTGLPAAIVEVDRTDFAVYRRNGRDAIPVLCPPEG